MEKIIKTKEEAIQLLNLASKAGHMLLENGAEIFRVEDTVQRMCNSWKGIEGVDVFAMTTSVFVTIKFDNEPFTSFIREKSPSLRLNKIDMINKFSRKFCSSYVSLDEGFRILENIESNKNYPIYVKSIAAGATAGFFSVMFGGNFPDFIASFIIGFVVFYLLAIPPTYMVPVFITDLLSGFLSAGFAALFMFLNLGNNIDMVIIGALMPYVPGIAITNAIRDILAGDYVSGLVTATKAIFTAIAIAFGVGIVLFIYFGG